MHTLILNARGLHGFGELAIVNTGWCVRVANFAGYVRSAIFERVCLSIM